MEWLAQHAEIPPVTVMSRPMPCLALEEFKTGASDNRVILRIAYPHATVDTLLHVSNNEHGYELVKGDTTEL